LTPPGAAFGRLPPEGGAASGPAEPDPRLPPDDAHVPAGAIAPAELALLASVFVVAACGLVYELAAGALASYLLGDSVLQFSTIIGTYLFAMGMGSWLSRSSSASWWRSSCASSCSWASSAG
jgi:hypothetical protein